MHLEHELETWQWIIPYSFLQQAKLEIQIQVQLKKAWCNSPIKRHGISSCENSRHEGNALWKHMARFEATPMCGGEIGEFFVPTVLMMVWSSYLQTWSMVSNFSQLCKIQSILMFRIETCFCLKVKLWMCSMNLGPSLASSKLHPVIFQWAQRVVAVVVAQTVCWSDVKNLLAL